MDSCNNISSFSDHEETILHTLYKRSKVYVNHSYTYLQPHALHEPNYRAVDRRKVRFYWQSDSEPGFNPNSMRISKCDFVNLVNTERYPDIDPENSGSPLSTDFSKTMIKFDRFNPSLAKVHDLYICNY